MISSYMSEVFRSHDVITEPAVLLKEFRFYLKEIPEADLKIIKIVFKKDLKAPIAKV